jgi:site-specific recombinase XerD
VEIAKLLGTLRNVKHRAMLTLIYSSGLRISELINMKIDDVDSQNMRLWVRNAKGRKDRITLLARHTLQLLRQYYRAYKPEVYLFEGQSGGRYSATSLRKVLEQGVNLRYIQQLLGHNSSRTTEIYTHVCATNLLDITSPIDNLMQNTDLGEKSYNAYIAHKRADMQ